MWGEAPAEFSLQVRGWAEELGYAVVGHEPVRARRSPKSRLERPCGPPSQIVPIPPPPLSPPFKRPIIDQVTGLISCPVMLDDCMKSGGFWHKAWCVTKYILCTAMEEEGGA